MIEKKYFCYDFDKRDVLSDPLFLKGFLLPEDDSVEKDFLIDREVVLSQYVIGFCTKGYCKIKIGFKEFEVTEGCMLILLAKHVVQPLEWSEDYTLKKMVFSVDFMLDIPMYLDFNLLVKMGDVPVLKVSEEIMQNFLAIYAQVKLYYNNKDIFYRNKLLKALISALVTDILSIYQSLEIPRSKEKLSSKVELTKRFFGILIKNIEKERSVAFYADKMCVTTKYLSFSIKCTTGQTAIEYINHLSIIVAKIRLKSTTDTVAQIADELNFPTPTSFGKFFREQTGMTPLEYRNQIN